MLYIDIYEDCVNEEGTIDSGKDPVNTLLVSSLAEVKDALVKEYPNEHWQACANGSDGMFESSDGSYGPCLVSNVRR